MCFGRRNFVEMSMFRLRNFDIDDRLPLPTKDQLKQKLLSRLFQIKCFDDVFGTCFDYHWLISHYDKTIKYFGTALWKKYSLSFTAYRNDFFRSQKPHDIITNIFCKNDGLEHFYLDKDKHINSYIFVLPKFNGKNCYYEANYDEKEKTYYVYEKSYFKSVFIKKKLDKDKAVADYQIGYRNNNDFLLYFNLHDSLSVDMKKKNKKEIIEEVILKPFQKELIEFQNLRNAVFASSIMMINK